MRVGRIERDDRNDVARIVPTGIQPREEMGTDVVATPHGCVRRTVSRVHFHFFFFFGGGFT
jgi:hypothetical protein